MNNKEATTPHPEKAEPFSETSSRPLDYEDHSQSTASGSDHIFGGSQSQASQETQITAASQNSRPTSAHRPETPDVTARFKLADHSFAADVSPARGAKRTASGFVKPPSPTREDLCQSTNPDGRGHTRTSSTESLSRASELSSQLKARLSYAMVKVQNGWESRSIDEVEQLASQMHSPISPRRPSTGFRSPRHDLAQAASRSRNLIALTSDLDVYGQRHDRYARGQMSPGTPGYVDGQCHFRQPPPNSEHQSRPRTLETGPPLASAQLPPSRTPTAPRTRTHSDVTDARQLTSISTPTPREQDAVDTLLLMSSPANSTTFGRRANGLSTTSSSAQTSPTQSAFGSDYPHTNFSPSHQRDQYDRIPRKDAQQGSQSMDKFMAEIKEYGGCGPDNVLSRSTLSRNVDGGGARYTSGIRRA